MAINLAYDATFTTNISANMIPFYNQGTGVSYTDSGGPGVIDKNGNKIVIGASSWGKPPKDQLPTIYTNVRNYAAWIQTETGIQVSKPGIDLYTKDKPWDMGHEPANTGNMWESEDIWIRNQNDGFYKLKHQDPEYYTDPDKFNYVYVRVRNRGCLPSTGNEKVKLYWAKAGTALAWPNFWNGSQNVNGQPIGDFLGEYTLPVIEPGSTAIAVFPWQPPNPADFVGLAGNHPLFWIEEPHHFCLLSRIEAANDPMTLAETIDLGANVNGNNNIAWKNVSVIDADPLNSPTNDIGLLGATVLVGDAWGGWGPFDVNFLNPPFVDGNPIMAEAEIKVSLDIPLWEKWEAGGFKGKNVQIKSITDRQVILTGDSAALKNLTFAENERNLLHVSFNFLTDKVTAQENFAFNIIQTLSSNNYVLGGEQYIVRKGQRDLFYANAGEDREVFLADSTTLSANLLTEQAIYNWYDQSGSLIFTGKDFTVAPEVTTRYKLEVIATADGFIDYDEVEVSVREFDITSVSPNPSSSFVNIGYRATTATSAYIMVVPHFTGTSNQYILDSNSASKTINVSNYPQGLYSIVLICNGVIADYQNLLIQ